MAELELVTDLGQVASAGRFFKAGNDLVALLDELSETPVDWVVSTLRTGSALAVVSAPETDVGAQATLADTVHGLSRVTAGEGEPPDWTPDAVKAAQALTSVGANDEDKVTPRARLRLVGDDEVPTEIALNGELADRMAQLHPFERRMPGAVRGRLLGMNIARGNRASLKPVEGRVVRVKYGNELRQTIKDNLLDVPVELVGEVRQDSQGHNFHIQAEYLRVLATPTISWTDLFGYDPDITGGLSVEDYLEQSRGEA